MSSIFIYADFCKGSIWGLQPKGDRWQSTLLIDAGTPISSIGSDETGNLYATAYALGKIIHLVPKVNVPGADNEDEKETEGSEEESAADTPENAADNEDGANAEGNDEESAAGTPENAADNEDGANAEDNDEEGAAGTPENAAGGE